MECRISQFSFGCFRIDLFISWTLYTWASLFRVLNLRNHSITHLLFLLINNYVTMDHLNTSTTLTFCVSKQCSWLKKFIVTYNSVIFLESASKWLYNATQTLKEKKYTHIHISYISDLIYIFSPSFYFFFNFSGYRVVTFLTKIWNL